MSQAFSFRLLFRLQLLSSLFAVIYIIAIRHTLTVLRLFLIHSAYGATDIKEHIYKPISSTPAMAELKNDKIPSTYSLSWRAKDRFYLGDLLF
jgi:hypothetical protein